MRRRAGLGCREGGMPSSRGQWTAGPTRRSTSARCPPASAEGRLRDLAACARLKLPTGGQLMSSAHPETPTLQAVLDAFNAHDVDAIMSFFTEDCVFDTPRGPAPGGRRLVGKEQVREGFQARFDGIPDIVYGDDRHWTCGDR